MECADMGQCKLSNGECGICPPNKPADKGKIAPGLGNNPNTQYTSEEAAKKQATADNAELKLKRLNKEGLRKRKKKQLKKRKKKQQKKKEKIW
jgi:hypothetical protein